MEWALAQQRLCAKLRKGKSNQLKPHGGTSMTEEEIELIERVKDENRELYKLYLEHIDYEKKLEQMNKLRYPTPEQEMERKKLQKLKLYGKDKIAKILREYKSKENRLNA